LLEENKLIKLQEKGSNRTAGKLYSDERHNFYFSLISPIEKQRASVGLAASMGAVRN
jgi:hypothetical protein